MSTSKLGIKYLGKLVVLYLPLLLLILLFSMIDSTTYTYVPLFIQYIISTLENKTVLNLDEFLEKVASKL